MKYVNVKTIFNYISLPDDAIEDHYVQEYAAQALREIGVPSIYEQKVCLLDVTNHKANLPKDFKMVEALMYTTNKAITSTSDSVISTTSSTEDGIKTTVITETAGTDYNESLVDNMQYQGVLNNYQLWVDSRMFKENFSLLRYVRRAGLSHVCDYCPNIGHGCLDWFTITPQNQILTNLDDCTLCLFYLSWAKDCDGALLIPDDVTLHQALAAYVTSRYYEAMSHLDPSTFQRYQFELQRWSMTKQKARGRLNMLSLDYNNLIAIADMYLDWAKSPIVFDNLKY